jgi:outer membrane protein OmpA-like peptidoglycan-associated protein
MPAAGNNAADIVFVAGSSQLLQPAADEVKAFAAKRGNAVISITGYGDATAGDPAAQSAAVTLGLARAQAIVAALKSDGVPADAIRVNAEASGRGASLRLLH